MNLQPPAQQTGADQCQKSVNHAVFTIPCIEIQLYLYLCLYSLVKDGVCPKAATFGACIVTCGADEDCDGSKKCCSNGCGAWCVEPSKNLLSEIFGVLLCF